MGGPGEGFWVFVGFDEEASDIGFEVDVAYFFESIVRRAGRVRKASVRRSAGAKTARRKGRSARR